jgi:hypothetical protein
VHVEMRSANFLVEPQNKGQWFNLKTTVTVFSILILKLAVVFPGLTSKSVAWVFWLVIQNRQLRFGDLCLKNNSYNLVICASKSP